MIFDEPLPNDLLRNPPWPQTIMTWPINEAFLSIIADSEAKLRELGYYLKFGIEANLGILLREEATKYRDRKYSPFLVNWRQACRDQFAHDLHETNDLERFSKTAALVYSHLEVLAKEMSRRSGPECTQWLLNWQLTQSFYRQAPSPKATKKSVRAGKDFMIASLHLLPQQLGGLNGLIQQRFASAHYGIGWWDHGNTVELRTHPVPGAESAIANYHEVMWRLQSAAEQFGFMPNINIAVAQPHFSLWRISDNTNVMEVDTEENLSIRKRFAEVFYSMFDRLPIGRFSRMIDMNPIDHAPFVGSSRTSTIRTCADNWELRLPHPGGVTHLARDLFYITWAAQTAIKPRDTSWEQDEETKKVQDYIYGQLLGEAGLPKRPIKNVRRITIAADPPRVACPFISCLEGSVLGDNDEILTPSHVFIHNRHLLAEAVGCHSIDLFSVQDGDEIINLEVVEGWQELFKTIRVNDDLTLDISTLHPHLAAHFKGLSVASIRSDVHMPEGPTVDFEQREYVDLIKANLLATDHRIGIEPAEAGQEIFGFLRDRNFTFDPEEANMWLLPLYGTQRKKFTPRQMSKEAVAEALQEYIKNFMGNYVFYALRYNAGGLDNLTPFFGENDIVKSMISAQETTLQALPGIAHFDPPHSERFFATFGNCLRDTTKLYEFPHIVETLEKVLKTLLDVVVHNINTTDSLRDAFKKFFAEDEQGMYAAFADVGRPVGESVMRLVAAAQTSDEATSTILKQYIEQATTLAARIKQPEVKIDGEDSIIKTDMALRLHREIVSATGDSIAKEAQRLLRDRSPLVELRQKARESLQPTLT